MEEKKGVVAKRKRTDFSELLLVYLLIATSGIPYFVGSYFLMPLSLAYALFICFAKNIDIFDKRLIVILIVMVVIVNLREIVNGYSPTLYETLVIILKYSFPFIVLKITQFNFIKHYNLVMYYIALSSLVFFTVFSLFPVLESFFISFIAPVFKMASKSQFYEYAPSFILYTFTVEGRNAGPFWEPGGFVVFLVISLVFHLFQKHSLLNKQGIVLLLAMLTTFSTAGYVALFFILIAYALSLKRKIYIYLLLPILFIVSFNFYSDSYFLKEKVLKHYSTTRGDYEGRVANRFTSVLIDFDRIIDHPILGVPKGSSGEYSIYSHRNNGLSGMAVSYGLIYFALYFLLTYQSLRKIQMFYGFTVQISLNLAMLAIFAIFFGQVLTDKPLINTLFMLTFFKFRPNS